MSLIWVVSCSNAVVIAQWLLFGYSLAFSSTANNGFIGDLGNMGLRNVLDDPSPGSTFLPELLYSFYQMEFACVTVGILVGAIAERGRVLPMMVVTLFWTTLVYCPLAYWAWGKNGWAFKWGVLDFAGKYLSRCSLLPISNMFPQVAVQSKSAAVLAAWFMHGSSDVAVKKS
jgi:Amt family ammonium transporter